MSDPYFLVAAPVFGAVVGSYLNVVILRLPNRGESLGPRSVCANPECRKPVPWYLNLPIVGWFILGGKARCCGFRLSPRYPLVEALTAAMFYLLAAWPPFGAPLTLAQLTATALLAFAFHAFFVANLIANTFIDIDHRILPDALTKPLMIVGLLGSLVVPGLAGTFPVEIELAANSFMFSAFGLAAGFGLTWAVRALARAAFRKEAMGFGDVKLMGGVGAFVGWDGALVTFFLGSLFGAVGGSARMLFHRDPYVAFGPYLALGAVVSLFCRGSIITFLTVTWPEWQRTNRASPWVLGGIGLLCLALLYVVVRRGRAP